MAKLEPTVVRNNIAPLKRVSWGAIFGGTFIALAIMVLLGSLGIAIGATTIDPRTGDTPSLQAFSIGAGIWWLVSGIIALFGGGWATSKLAGPRWGIDSILHGVVTWSFTTTLSFVLMTTVVGSMVSGAMRLLGKTAEYAAQGASALASQMDDDTPPRARERSAAQRDPASWDEVWRDAQALLRRNIRQVAAGGGGAAQGAGNADQAGQAEQTGQTDQAAQAQSAQIQSMLNDLAATELQVTLLRLFYNDDRPLSAADRDAVVQVLVTRTQMSQPEARAAVSRWADRFQGDERQGRGNDNRQAGQAAGGAAAQVRQAAVNAAEATANAVATAAWWTFFFFIATALAAAGGAFLGGRRRGQGYSPSDAGDTVGPPTAAGSPQRNDLTRTPLAGSEL